MAERNDPVLGRVAGIDIKLNWTVLGIVALLTWSLASFILPSQASGYSDAAYWIAGLGAALGLLGSILAHELGHAIVARRNGVAVKSITLWLFGGVAMLEDEAPSPKAEAKIAAVGPAISFAVGLAAGALAVTAAILGFPSLLVVALWWLAGINGVLAVFNLVPGAPLDGGRLLHAFLWRRHGDRLRATVSASKAGRAFGMILVGLGFAQVLLLNDLGGLWTAMIGWFLAGAAGAEAQQSVTRHALEGVTVREVMTPHPDLSPDWITVEEFIQRYVLSSRHSTYPLEGWDGTLSGLVTLNDLKAVPATDRADTRVRTVATPVDRIPQCSPDDQVTVLLEKFAASGYPHRRALVFSEGVLVGIVTSSDIARAVERGALAGGSQGRAADVAA